MSSLNNRLKNLTPEQRAVLEKRMKAKGMNTAVVSSTQESSALPPNMLAAMGGGQAAASKKQRPRLTDKGMEFSIFFFSGDGSTEDGDKYRMLIDSVKYADQHGFKAVWTPERHFEDFGGLYPNPSVLSAALAMITENIQIRAGSVALPLHHPIRFVEEWAVVDNLSGGRTAVSFASGWHPSDFLIAPTPTRDYYNQRKEVMIDNIKTIKKLWSGETVQMIGIDGQEQAVKVLPRPLQDELEIWVATNGSEDTYIKAAETGSHILTGLTNQTLDEFEEKIKLYRETLAQHGFDPEQGKITVMLHTCVGETNEEIKNKVRDPLKDYLKTFIKQQKNVMGNYDDFSEADQDAIVTYAFDKYFAESSLFGTVDKCSGLIEDLIDIGVNEVACLVDFGISTADVMSSMNYLGKLKDKYTL
ncbi:LLM class flavin-dependent oxidoreductase [Tumebacillus algifaecis]|uniref:LLM class flavin-dependent oxidoreductase n=1 Tax=Tumebacillus algifaecis TaxID=1214604 RepID=A0A223CZW1_9BACL|nr:MupA/Atu3671 family FMN-dependent luciferase-like monooxygenase [Tumebacillus algifaecis]ASS74683.1 LLM class flavin-dependent oxidoreductase [Tumebacillus algifaecis]